MEKRSGDIKIGEANSTEKVVSQSPLHALVSDTLVVDTLCLGTGLLFVAAGSLKFLLPSPGAGVDAGAHGFGQMLSMLNVPFPMVFGHLVPATEVLGGLGLMTRRSRRLWTVPLILDMVMAIALIGLPGALGRPVHIGSMSIGSEPWRLPLEVGLLIALLWLWWPNLKIKAPLQNAD
jgi:uncharacterized membrane protein YphA (DoxX/SURF4 family)